MKLLIAFVSLAVGFTGGIVLESLNTARAFGASEQWRKQAYEQMAAAEQWESVAGRFEEAAERANSAAKGAHENTEKCLAALRGLTKSAEWILNER